MAGTVRSSSFISNAQRELHRGFAVASADTGHEGQDQK